jgi:hypothetical protein
MNPSLVIPRSVATRNLLSAGAKEKHSFSLRFEMTTVGGGIVGNRCGLEAVDYSFHAPSSLRTSTSCPR